MSMKQTDLLDWRTDRCIEYFGRVEEGTVSDVVSREAS